MDRDEFNAWMVKVRRLQAEGALPTEPTREQYVSRAFGRTAIENPNVTRDHAEEAVRRVVDPRV